MVKIGGIRTPKPKSTVTKIGMGDYTGDINPDCTDCSKISIQYMASLMKSNKVDWFKFNVMTNFTQSACLET